MFLLLLLTGVGHGEVQGPEDTTGGLEWYSVGERHIPEVNQLHQEVLSVDIHFVERWSTHLCHRPDLPVGRDQGKVKVLEFLFHVSRVATFHDGHGTKKGAELYA